MSHVYETECPKCHLKVKVVERPMGVPGGKEKEQGFCPNCNEIVAEFMTDGFIDVELVKPVNVLKIDFEVPYLGEKLSLEAVEELRDLILKLVTSNMLKHQHETNIDVQRYDFRIGHIETE